MAPSAVHLTSEGFVEALGRVPDEAHALMEFFMPVGDEDEDEDEGVRGALSIHPSIACCVLLLPVPSARRVPSRSFRCVAFPLSFLRDEHGA